MKILWGYKLQHKSLNFCWFIKEFYLLSFIPCEYPQKSLCFCWLLREFYPLSFALFGWPYRSRSVRSHQSNIDWLDKQLRVCFSTFAGLEYADFVRRVRLKVDLVYSRPSGHDWHESELKKQIGLGQKPDSEKHYYCFQ